MLSPSPLFSLARGGHEEVCVFGEIALTTGDGDDFCSCERESRLPARSLLKPFQFLATGFADGGSVDAELVFALGSIDATPAQVEELRASRGATDELLTHLDLPNALPLCPEGRVHALATGGRPSPLYHPCFSKHLAILAACRAERWPLAGYTAATHPFHERLLAVLSPLLQPARDPLEFATDGCRLPTPLLGSLELAHLYRLLATAAAGSALGTVRRAMLDNPERIGGPNRVDTRLMLLNPGRLIAKEGADGLLAIGVCPTPAAPAGAGLLIKLAGGHQPAWAALAAQPFLEALGLEPLREPTPGQSPEWHVHPQRAARSALDISPALSERIAVWPGDTAFRRSIVSEPGTDAGVGSGTTPASGPGWELLVSSIQTTLHVGAHADAPNHFMVGGVGIDRVPLGVYRGHCEVIEVDLPPGASIHPRDLTRTPGAPRLLFKTGSFPNPERFNADFVAFSPELITWAEQLGVLLIGIDTPSVDPFSSTTLPSHHATRSGRGLAILEGLDLSQVQPGHYELVALPLRLEGADASPVRATLWPLR
jgi:arylformamidase